MGRLRLTLYNAPAPHTLAHWPVRRLGPRCRHQAAAGSGLYINEGRETRRYWPLSLPTSVQGAQGGAEVLPQ